MKLTLGQIQGIMNNPGFGTFLTKVLPIKASFELARLRRALSDEMVLFQEKKGEIINKYAHKDPETNKTITDDKGNVTIPTENAEAFNTAYQELTSIECELANINKIVLDVKDAPAIASTEADVLLDIIELVG